jgi:hypothetical protein
MMPDIELHHTCFIVNGKENNNYYLRLVSSDCYVSVDTELLSVREYNQVMRKGIYSISKDRYNYLLDPEHNRLVIAA